MGVINSVHVGNYQIAGVIRGVKLDSISNARRIVQIAPNHASTIDVCVTNRDMSFRADVIRGRFFSKWRKAGRRGEGGPETERRALPVRDGGELTARVSPAAPLPRPDLPPALTARCSLLAGIFRPLLPRVLTVGLRRQRAVLRTLNSAYDLDWHRVY